MPLRLRACGGDVGVMVRCCGFFFGGRWSGSVIFPTLKQRRAGTQTAIEIDNAKTRHRSDARVRNGILSGLAGKLPDRFDEPEETASRTRLTDGKLAA